MTEEEEQGLWEVGRKGGCQVLKRGVGDGGRGAGGGENGNGGR